MQAGMAVGNLASAIGIRTEEAALVAELKAGSEEAFGLLIAQYHQPLYSLIAAASTTPPTPPTSPRKSSSRSSAASASFQRRRQPAHLALPHRAARGSNQRRWWSRHKRQEIAIDASAEPDEPTTARPPPSPPPSPTAPAPRSTSAAQAELRQRVEAALRELPEAFRTVVVLREIEGSAYEEIAEILDTNLGTVKSRLTREDPHCVLC